MSLCLFVSVPLYLSVAVSVCLCLSVCLSVCRSVGRSVGLSSLSPHPPSLSLRLPVTLFVFLSFSVSSPFPPHLSLSPLSLSIVAACLTRFFLLYVSDSPPPPTPPLSLPTRPHAFNLPIRHPLSFLTESC